MNTYCTRSQALCRPQNKDCKNRGGGEIDRYSYVPEVWETEGNVNGVYDKNYGEDEDDQCRDWIARYHGECKVQGSVHLHFLVEWL